ncbi:unnamed protein product [Vitrella brassicaformis CCMP3155]|uniref:EF-hand domain-containing protein n=1 Tax=Vitrella brassicaformis (strain CCMP3155) TaxID=1169540 RepID=A0A0G4FRU6_VITBC|nr:unnamed protein product [Vitrella brassicaformis CCMP3155]|mmetsp:Transcript_46582/g.115987  ORF Transcript_46582/g.115987 Transcript_46582/m.115987 type:complete len:267 (-) Transcript_46582:3052-3852(-)|eukprot:CEM16825.1 unnamed protein product [Vitrella brassicaformis CCMP3155]
MCAKVEIKSNLPPPHSRTETFRNAVGDDKLCEEIIDTLKSFDKDGDGKFDIGDVAAAARQVVVSRKTNRHLRWSVVGLAIGWVLTLLVLFGLVIASIRLMRQSTIANDGLMRTVGKSSVPVRTQPNTQAVQLWDVVRKDIPVRQYDDLMTVSYKFQDGTDTIYRVDWIEQKPNEKLTIYVAGGRYLVATEDSISLYGTTGDLLEKTAYPSKERRRLQVDFDSDTEAARLIPGCIGLPELCCQGAASCLSGLQGTASLSTSSPIGDP